MTECGHSREQGDVTSWPLSGTPHGGQWPPAMGRCLQSWTCPPLTALTLGLVWQCHYGWWKKPLSQVSAQLCNEDQQHPRTDMLGSVLPVALPPPYRVLWIQEPDRHHRGGDPALYILLYDLPMGRTGFCFLPCSPGWPYSHYVADGDLEFLRLLPAPGANAGTTGVHH